MGTIEEDGDVFNERESSQIALEQFQLTMSSIKVSPCVRLKRKPTL